MLESICLGAVKAEEVFNNWNISHINLDPKWAKQQLFTPRPTWTDMNLKRHTRALQLVQLKRHQCSNPIWLEMIMLINIDVITAEVAKKKLVQEQNSLAVILLSTIIHLQIFTETLMLVLVQI